ncbi:rhomboid family intramembrane serine protease [Niabella sp. CC-SYL272]|uniref:rhomboid family intramembrane serine protease n=1 Tax=Niabella agricola TaxID=2891571 RepID=UPI001F401B3A|nr:rhomboid family intramembrane serine protease [Niabella agricola]MCF3111965.1 rhomboid family intramembrane serine protease [Niabella agricola]
MAMSLSPKYTQDVSLDNFSREQFLVIALEAAKKLNWNIGNISETGFVAYTKFSAKSWSEAIELTIENREARLKSECTGNQVVDWGKNKENIENLLSTVNEIKNDFTPQMLAQRYEELQPALTGTSPAGGPPPVTKTNFAGFLSFFKPTKGYFITPILIDLNIVIFLLMIASGVNILVPDSGSLISWGANFRPITLSGEWWRLVTSCFIHIGIFHLFMNLYALLYIGLLLEPLLGTTRFAAAYLLTGIAASVTSLWWHDLTVSAGASGAIFGLYGVFLALLTTNHIEKSARKAFLTSIGVFVGYNLLNGLKGGIDNAAHIGGLISGLLIGYAYFPGLKHTGNKNQEYKTTGILAVLVLSVSFYIYKKLPNDIGNYDAKMKTFVLRETAALGIYSLPQHTPKNKLLLQIKDSGIYYWQENIKLINELEQLKLPDAIHDRNKKLLDYCALRIKSYQFIYKAVDQDTDRYKDSIDYYNQRIETIINELKGP